jgi:hypothetical protein
MDHLSPKNPYALANFNEAMSKKPKTEWKKILAGLDPDYKNVDKKLRLEKALRKSLGLSGTDPLFKPGPLYEEDGD